MAESLLQKAQRLGVQPVNAPTETLLEKAQRLGIKPIQTEKPNYFERVGGEFSRIGSDLTTSLKEGGQSYLKKARQGNVLGATGSLLRSGLRAAGAVAEGAVAPIIEAPVIKQVLEGAVRRAVEIPGVKDVVSKATEIAQKYPKQAKDLQNIIDIATLGGGKAIESPAIKEARLLGRDVVEASRTLMTPTEEAVQKNVVELFSRSIKPSMKSVQKGVRYENDVLKALQTIKANADKLNIEDLDGELVSRTPQTVQEMAQALDQTKVLVFNQYDTLAKQAGKTGAVIDAKPIANEVLQVAQNKALQITNPEVIKYAENWAERLQGLDVLDTETTQAVIKNLNESLKAFYRNPTYESASKATVDAAIANNFRQALDKAIQSATGEEYQVLKNQYAALKSIEDDVIRSAARDARKNVKGLLDYSDIFTSGQMIGGIFSLNPAMFTKGAIERGIKEYFKFLNDPNRAISNIFENLNIDTTKAFEPLSKTGQFLKNPKLGMSIEDVSKQGDNLLQEARKYKSAEEFIKAQGTPVYHGGTEIKEVGNMRSKWRAFYMTDNPTYAKSYGGNKSVLNKMVITKKAKLADLIKPSDDLIKQIDEIISPKATGETIKIKKPDGSFVEVPKTKGGLSNPVHSSADIIQGIKDGKAYYAEMPEVKEALKKLGYDGMITQESKFGVNYGVWNKKVIKTKSQLTDIWNKANKTNADDALIQEARKYKSAEEFVKAQGTPVYHGTNHEPFDPTKSVSKDGLYGKGVYFATDKSITTQYGSKTIEAYLDKNSLLKINEPLTTIQKTNLRKVMGKDEWDWNKNPTGEFVWKRLELTHKNPEEILKKAGIKGIQHEQYVKGGKNINYTIFDNSAIKTKSQLTDIFNKAHKK